MKDIVISGASPVLMPREDPAGKIVFVIVLLIFCMACFVALMSFMAAEKARSDPPVPHRASAETTATKPMAANTRCPVMSISIIDANMSSAIIS